MHSNNRKEGAQWANPSPETQGGLVWTKLYQRVVKPRTNDANSNLTKTRIKLHAIEAMRSRKAKDMVVHHIALNCHRTSQIQGKRALNNRLHLPPSCVMPTHGKGHKNRSQINVPNQVVTNKTVKQYVTNHPLEPIDLNYQRMQNAKTMQVQILKWNQVSQDAICT